MFLEPFSCFVINSNSPVPEVNQSLYFICPIVIGSQLFIIYMLVLWELINRHKNYARLCILAYLILQNVIKTDCIILSKISTPTLCVWVFGGFFFSPSRNPFNNLWWQTSAKNGGTESTYLVDVSLCYILWVFFHTVIYDFWHLNCIGHYHFILHALLRKNYMAKH